MKKIYKHTIISPDVDVPHPDEKSIITYVSSLYDAMPRDVQDGIQANVSALLTASDHFILFLQDCP